MALPIKYEKEKESIIMKKMFLTLLLLLSCASVFANDCSSFKEDTPVLAGGREKPLFVLAKESIKFLTGKSKHNSESQLTTLCNIILNGQAKKEYKFPVLVEHFDTKKYLGLSEDTKYMNALELITKKDLIRSEIMRLKENNSYKKDLTKTFNRLQTFESLYEGKALTVFTKKHDHEENEYEWESIVNHFESHETITNALTQSKINYDNQKGTDYLLELTYVKSNIYSYSMLLVLIGIFLTVLSKNLKYGVIFSILTILLETTAITWRVLISGRAPITNMYETVMFSGYGALIIGLIILYFKRDKVFLLAGLAYNLLCLFMMMFANNMLSSSISPLVPVLRDNFWLSTHVTTIILSYAALALSWMIANITLFKLRFKKITQKEYNYYQQLTYTCIKVGIILLSAGIILGGVWADYSWGRFWGWDPKETWSLIVLLFYMIIVHGRYTSWINTHRFTLMSAGGFMLVMMAWFGVNYILASGLHSYGFSEGGAIFLGTFFLVQTVILIICAKQPELEKA